MAVGGGDDGSAKGGRREAGVERAIPGNREDDLTAWLRERLGAGNLLGDDAAVLPELPAGSRLVATVDSQIAGVHYPEWLPVEIAARRLLAVNLSDLAAMGAEPRWGLLALSGPLELDRKAYFEGLVAACDEWGVELVGGDLARTAETVIGSLTLLGELPEGRRALRRDGAEPGHGVWVSGTLGESAAGRRLLERGTRVERVAGSAVGDEQISKGKEAAGRASSAGRREGAVADDRGSTPGGALAPRPESRFRSGWRVTLPGNLPADLYEPARRAVWRHLDPVPELALGRALAEAGHAGALMDLSDGLATDLPRLCRASHVGAEIDASALPTAPAFGDLCAWLGADLLDLALGGGEDYALLFTLPGNTGPPPAGHRVGEITRGGITLRTGAGRSAPFPAGGWDHLTAGPRL